MAPQVYSWTCSACSLDWLKRSAGIDPQSTREQTVEQIGYPENISPQYGLHDGSGTRLREVIESYGVAAEQGWLDFDSAYVLAQLTTGCIGGASWYHWVALRGIEGDSILVANSAPGWGGIGEPGILTRQDWERLGPFAVVWLA